MPVVTGTLCSAALPWLPVLPNIEPPPLRCKAAVDKLIEMRDLLAEWPLCNCVPSSTKLSDILQAVLDRHSPKNIMSQWRDKWKLALVVNSSVVDDRTIQQPGPGFDLPRRYVVS